MELKRIKELMSAMVRHGMCRMTIKDKDFELSLEREQSIIPVQEGKSRESASDVMKGIAILRQA